MTNALPGRFAGQPRYLRLLATIAIVAGIGGCTSNNLPINRPLEAMALQDTTATGREVENHFDDMVVALSFSGGGMRAAAFAHGVLTEFAETTIRTRSGPVSLADRIDILSGVSGGAIPAAYFGLKKRSALLDFRERFLLRNAEEALSTNMTPINLAKGFSGGVNDATQFPRWLDANLFNGATFADMSGSRPRVSINASDIYNRTPFLFGKGAFGALCSDFDKYPVSVAVAASAAVPVVFSPVIIENFHDRCPLPLPPWVERVRSNNDAAPMLRQYADAIVRYRQGDVKYVKLLDGGLVDNYGLAGFTISRLLSNTPHGPLSAREGVKLRRLLFLIVDAGRAPAGDWAKTIAGPSGMELVMATADTATGSSAAQSYTAFNEMMNDYQAKLIAWRCRLSQAERARLGAGPGWNCRDVKFFVGRVGFEQLGPQRAAQLSAVDTRFQLPAQQVDLVIDAGRDALRANVKFRAFLESLGGPGPRGPAPRRPSGVPVAEETTEFPREATALAPR